VSLLTIIPDNQTAAALWAVVELNVWIVVACIPALRPFVTRVYTKVTSTTGTSFKIGSYTFSWKRSSHSGIDSDMHNKNSASLPPGQRPQLNFSPKENSNSTHVSGQHKHDIYRSLLAPETNRDAESDTMELGNVPGIRVERDIKITRPEEAHYAV
jgi:hypothetical protein